MNDILIMIVVSIGTFVILIAAIGFVRMPDLYLRLSVTTKAATLGVGLTLLGLVLFFMEIGITTRAIAIIVFLFLTVPISGHIIGRAGYFAGDAVWKKTKIDELEGMYDPKTHKLKSGLEKNEEKEKDSPR